MLLLFLVCAASWPLASLPTERPVRTRVIETARKYVGTTERGGPNRGPEVDRWNRAVGAPLGSPWCGAYTSGVLTEAGAREPRVRTALAKGFVTKASFSASSVLVGRYKPKPGDVVVWTRRSGGHVGFIEQARSPDTFVTIEGNTSSGKRGSQWNGDGVYRRTRRIEPYNAFRIIAFTPVR